MELYYLRAAMCSLAMAAACEADDDDYDSFRDGADYCDCNEYATCEDGVSRRGGPETCGGCGFVREEQCEHGCWTDSVFDPNHEEGSLCFEAHSHSVGDPCESDEDCLPTEARMTEDGFVTLFLECDEVAGACVEHDGPPLPPDWLGPCDPAAIGPYLVHESSGWVEDASCGGGVCIVIGWDCMGAGCVTPCEFDWDCAQGTFCSEMWAFGGEGEDRKLCMPDLPFEGFECY